MSIVSSVYVVEAHAQIDGRRYVKETHTDHLGGQHHAEYLAPDGTNYQAIANSRAVLLEQQLAEDEAEALING